MADKKVALTLFNLLRREPENAFFILDKTEVYLSQVEEKERLLHLFKNLLFLLELEAKNRTVKVTSSFRLSDKLLNQIKQIVGAEKETLIEESIDPDLIGGFVANYNHKLYDASLRLRLNLLYKQLVN